VLTTGEISKYFVRYLGKQNADEIPCYVFAVKPRRWRRAAVFQGEIWVDDRDMQIVKTYGRGVGSWGRTTSSEVRDLPRADRRQVLFRTYTPQPTIRWTSNRAQRIRMLVKYENLQQFQERGGYPVRRSGPQSAAQDALRGLAERPTPKICVGPGFFPSGCRVRRIRYPML